MKQHSTKELEQFVQHGGIFFSVLRHSFRARIYMDPVPIDADAQFEFLPLGDKETRTDAQRTEDSKRRRKA